MEDWVIIQPKVKQETEFLEIATDFGEPLEIIREAISNSYDAGASKIRIHFYVDNTDLGESLILEIEDNGSGMSYEQLLNNFWDLGNSASKLEKEKIGEKGHGTKIYLRSNRITVITSHTTGTYESICEFPMRSLLKGELHQPKVRKIEDKSDTGTYIKIEGYNQSERARYLQNIVKDYILWFSKHGSFEKEFDITKNNDMKIELKCLDADEFQTITFGHLFAERNSDLDALFENYGTNAGEYFVKRYTKSGLLEKKPDVKFEMVIYIEGDAAKRIYNPLISNRKSKGYYKVADRYGLWIGKDYMPIQKVNDWISGFGIGSNSFVYIHGFINCQKLKLTANRSSIANTDPDTLMELKHEAQLFLDEINKDLTSIGLFTVSKWQDEDEKLEIEKAEFERRKKVITHRKVATINNRKYLEPLNESEVFGLFISIYTLFPEKFDFEPLDYNTSKGIDIVSRNKTENLIADCEFWYVEMKYKLSKRFNHSFKYTRWIVCWDFDDDILHDSTITTNLENDERTVKFVPYENKKKYFLEKPTEPIKITVLRLKEYLANELNIIFVDQ